MARKKGGASAPPATPKEAPVASATAVPAADAYVPNPELVPVTKDGTMIYVHPNGLAEHARLGWRQV